MTTFHVLLPASGGTSCPARSPKRKDGDGAGRLLVLDDGKRAETLLREMLGTLGYEAVVVPDGAEAVEAYRRARDAGTPFGGVIMDLAVVGGTGGVEVLHRLASFDPGVTAIASCGSPNDPVMADLARYGFRGAVRKPYRIRSLAKTLREVLGGYCSVS